MVDPRRTGGRTHFGHTESNPLTFPASEARQICMGGRARPGPIHPPCRFVEMSEREMGLRLTSPGARRPAKDFSRGCQDGPGGPPAARGSQGPCISAPCSQHHALTAMLSQPCSHSMLMGRPRHDQAHGQAHGQAQVRACSHGGSPGRLTGRLMCMLTWRLTGRLTGHAHR
jgi:hypothetical protein